MTMPRTGALQFIACAVFLGALLVESGAAHAQASDGAASFEQGRALWAAKDHVGALPHFQKAVELSASPNARIFLARCLRELGRYPEAYEEMEQTVRDARVRAETDPRYTETRDAAAAELAVLEGKVGRVSVALSPSLAGAQVWLNGRPLGVERVGKPVAVDTGAVRVTAKTATGETVEQTLEVLAGTLQSTTLATAGPAPLLPGPGPESEASDFGVVRGLGVGALGLGALGFVGFALGTVQADDAFATLESTCGTGPCDSTATADTISEGKIFEVIALSGLVVGIVGVAAGTIMLIVGEPASDSVAIDHRGLGVRF